MFLIKKIGMRKKIVLPFLLAAFFSGSAHAQQRIVNSINTDWKFHKGTVDNVENPSVKWKQISLPHTWNAKDVLDDEPGYYQGAGIYKKTLFVDASWKNKDVYLNFEGAGQVAEVYINGKKVGSHIGSYDFFSFPVNQYIDFSRPNELVIRLTNEVNQDIPPLAADFTFYGGIYRDVYLVAADPVHFDMDNYASQGVFVTPTNVNTQSANLQVKGAFVNHGPEKKMVSVITKLFDAQGKYIDGQEMKFTALPNEKRSFELQIKNLKNPKLWSPENPYLYRTVLEIKDVASGKQLDVVDTNVGFRWFSFDGQKGFFLNGKPYKLVGASRHQDYPGKGPALTDAMHVKDVQLLKEMGGNFIRIAHYPQDPSILETCDRLGLLASVETPIVGRVTETKAFSDNCKMMQTEMIRQCYNHPAVIMWAYMNEVMISPRHDNNTPEREQYWKYLVSLAKSLDSLSRAEDSIRYTMIPFHADYNLYKRTGMTEIPQVIGWNLYQGWYSGNIGDFDKFLERHHREMPNRPMMVTEYGADADARLHSFNAQRFDKTMEYANYYHRYYLKSMLEKPYVAGAIIWNLVEFNAEGRAEATPHMNTKGVLTGDRIPKDPYYLYQAYLLKQPFLKIGSRAWTLRSGIADNDSDSHCTQPVEIYSNMPNIKVVLNGKAVATAKTTDNYAVVNVPFTNGENLLEVVGADGNRTAQDATTIRFKLIPHTLTSSRLPFSDIHVSLGDERYFTDEQNGTVWLPEQPYKPGSWGYIGGDVFKLKNNDRLPYGSDRNILRSDDDAIYQTQRVGLKQFKLDVPDGVYEVTFHFVELYTDKVVEPLVYNYNLGKNTAENETAQSRKFNVSVNGIPVLEGLGNDNYLQQLTPYIVKTRLSVLGGKGLTADFVPVKGNAILNAIEAKRL